MKKFSVALLALATILAFAPAAMADPIQINGSIGITGGNDTWSATGVSFGTTTALITDHTGAYNSIPFGSPATITENALTFASAAGEIFTFTYGSEVGTFTITNLWVSLDNGVNLNVSGLGILSLTGYADTLGAFNFNSTDSNGNFGANSSTFGIDVAAEPAPEPESLLLFGTGLIGIAGLVRRKYMLSR